MGDVSQKIIASVGSGAAFGAALTASGVHLPEIIINQFQLTDFHMMKVFMVAMGASSGTMLALEKLQSVSQPVRSNSALGTFSKYDGNIVGGLMLGIGMALSGACPGTVIVQLAQGIPSARFTAVGALVGAGIYTRVKGRLQPTASASVEPQKTTLPEALNVSRGAVYLMLGASILAVLSIPRNAYNGIALAPLAGGALIGLAQATTLLSRREPLGVSASYEQASQYLWRALGFTDVQKPPRPPKAIFFSLGIYAGSLLLLSLQAHQFNYKTTAHVPVLRAILGGVAMTYGARTAGGCTSGHGLSGLGALSLSSLITTASIFGGGIATALLLFK